MSDVTKIPYFQTSRYRVATMVELAQPKSGEKITDLGSGDGRIVIAFGKTGMQAVGYETDENLRKLSLKNIALANLTNCQIQNKDFWDEDLSQYDIICCYPMPTIMGRLEYKLKKELKPGTRVLLNYFPFERWKEKERKDNVFLYVR